MLLQLNSGTNSKLFIRKKLYKKISENGYKLVEENFCVGNASIRLIDILKEVLDES